MHAIRIASPSHLARELDLPRQTVHRWLSDGIEQISYRNLLKLADTLNVNARWIMYGEIGPLKPPIKNPHEADAATIARALPDDLRDIWLLHGRLLVELHDARGPRRTGRRSAAARGRLRLAPPSETRVPGADVADGSRGVAKRTTRRSPSSRRSRP